MAADVGKRYDTFFLALLASIVGLARSLADLTALPAPIWGVGCGLMILFLSLSRAALGSRLVIGLGLLNVGLIVALILLMLPHVQPMTLPAAAQGSSFVMIGVSLMLFFAPILVAPIAQQVLPHGGSPRAFVYGSAGGVAAGVVLFALWTVAVCRVASERSLAEAVGASIPVIVATVPEVMFPAVLLGLALLGMTALRCALVLATLAEEQMPARLGWRRRNLFAQMPTGLALVVALVLLLSGTTSFTLLIAIAGGSAASVTSVVIPTLLTYCTLITKRRSAAPKQLVSGEHIILEKEHPYDQHSDVC